MQEVFAAKPCLATHFISTGKCDVRLAARAFQEPPLKFHDAAKPRTPEPASILLSVRSRTTACAVLR